MGSKSNSTSSKLRDLSRQGLTLSELFIPRPDRDDRSCAIVLGAALDAELEEQIQSRMVELEAAEIKGLFGEGSPLGSFAAKVKIGYAFGVFGPRTRSDLDLIRQIRNAFAHARRPITFDTSEVARTCLQLETPDRFPNELPPSAENAPEMRRRFEHAGEMLRFAFIFRDHPDAATVKHILHPLD